MLLSSGVHYLVDVWRSFDEFSRQVILALEAHTLFHACPPNRYAPMKGRATNSGAASRGDESAMDGRSGNVHDLECRRMFKRTIERRSVDPSMRDLASPARYCLIAFGETGSRRSKSDLTPVSNLIPRASLARDVTLSAEVHVTLRPRLLPSKLYSG